MCLQLCVGLHVHVSFGEVQNVMEWGECGGSFFIKKVENGGVFFCKKSEVDLSSTQGALCRVSVFLFYI